MLDQHKAPNAMVLVHTHQINTSQFQQRDHAGSCWIYHQSNAMPRTNITISHTPLKCLDMTILPFDSSFIGWPEEEVLMLRFVTKNQPGRRWGCEVTLSPFYTLET